jgi:type IV pilus secretin PilQ/predicted competence protein
MAGMKMRPIRIRKLRPSKAKGSIYGLFLFLLASAIPGFNNAQDKPNHSRLIQQSNPEPLSKIVNAGSIDKNASGATAVKKLSAGAITDIKIAPEGDKATVTVATDRLLAPQEFILNNPPRLVIDFPNTENRFQSSRLRVHTAAIKQIKVAQFQSLPSPIARMVFELEEDYGSHEMTVDKSSISLVFHKGPGKPGSESTAKPALKGAENVSLVKTPEARPNNPAPSPESAKTAPRATAHLKRDIKTDEQASNPTPRSTELPDKNLPASIEPAAKTAAAPIPLVAALTPASIAVPTTAQANSRFSGQPLTLDLVDTPLVDFFRLLAEEGGVNIVLDPAVKGSISIKVVKMPWDQIFEAVLANNALDKQVEGTLIRVARKNTLQEEARQQESLKKANLLAADLETRIKRLNYAKAVLLSKIIADQKTVRGSVMVDERTNALVLTDLPDSLDKQIQLIETLDVPQPQVEIEARIVSGTRDFARDIGIQFGFVDGNLQRVTVGGPNTFGTIGGTRPSSTPSSTYASGNAASGRGASSSTPGSSGAVSTGLTSNNVGNYNVNLPATKAYGGMGISIGNIFDTFLLDAAITAGESKGWAKLISQPRITAQNNSQAIITQGLRFPVPVSANNTVTVQFFNAALTLTVTPQITYEGNILLELKVENNTPDFGKRVGDVPSIRTSESSTRVLVSDGGTTLISGILIDDESNTEDKVPGLGSLPIIGNLFRRSSVAKSTQEVLFFVTPRIVK